MNNKEQIEKQIAELEQSHAEQIQKLRDELNRSESSQWVPSKGKCFWYIDRNGRVMKKIFDNASRVDNWLINIGNCFRTEEEAKNSLKYHVMNSEYDYWHAGFGKPKPKFQPKGLEIFDRRIGGWKSTNLQVDEWYSDFYRWKREEQ